MRQVTNLSYGFLLPSHLDDDLEDVNGLGGEGVEAGRVDILVNNAGCVTGKRLLDCTDAEIQRSMEVNTLAHFWTVVCPFFIKSRMFAGVRSRFSRLLPILDEEVVADRIVGAIGRDRAKVFLRRLVGFVPLLRVMPACCYDGLSNLLGINRAMDTFVGQHTGAAPVEANKETRPQ
ncbi:MAG: SDR family NAD(P)-dependent oxidoreductase [Planctomycetaceae bacterium]|jgi:short-subunit dehydrogenase|nr:SDR family NAD(P)-dependent oxidoreductase [Planctomycetaceae bacterium]